MLLLVCYMFSKIHPSNTKKLRHTTPISIHSDHKHLENPTGPTGTREAQKSSSPHLRSIPALRCRLESVQLHQLQRQPTFLSERRRFTKPNPNGETKRNKPTKRGNKNGVCWVGLGLREGRFIDLQIVVY